MTRLTPRSHQTGASLIEVLVAFLLLSFGLLGLSGMQINALKSNQSALQRSQATILAYFMMDAMRANRADAVALRYNTGTVATPECAIPADASLVTHDQRAWFLAMKSTLGDPDQACGVINCQANGQCSVRVYWSDRRDTRNEDDIALNGNQFIEIASQL